MTETTPTVIRGHMSNNYLRKMDRVFDGNIKTAIVEMLQNSRRAHATRINIIATHIPGDTAREGHIRMIWHDDGDGLDNPQMLLEVGDSDWDPDVTSDEDPGGQGFYSVLCAATAPGALVASRDWEAQINMESAKGLSDTPVVPMATITGMLVDFTFKIPVKITALYGYKSDTKAALPLQWLQGEIHTLSAVSGVVVTFNGVALPCFDFLMGANHVEVYRGVRIGVFCYEGSRDAPFPAEFKAWFGCYSGPLGNPVNFYGVHPHSETLPHLDRWGEDGKGTVMVKWDIVDTSAVKMTLPQRDKMKESVELNDVWNYSQKIATQTAVNYFAGEHLMFFTTWTALKKATGVNIPEATKQLRMWSIRDGDVHGGDSWPENASVLLTVDPSVEVIVIDDTPQNPSILGFHLMLGACYSHDWGSTLGHEDRTTVPHSGVFWLTDVTGDTRRVMLMRGSPNFRGYSWYDAMWHMDARTNSFTFEVEGSVDGKPVRSLDVAGDYAHDDNLLDGEFPSGKVDSLRLICRFGDRPAISLTLPFIMALTPTGHDARNGSMGDLLVACDAAGWDDFIRDRIYNCTGPFEDDTEDDDREQAARNVREFVDKVFHGSASIVKARMERAANEIQDILDATEIRELLILGKFRVTLNETTNWPRVVVTWAASLKEGKDLQG